MSPLLRNLSTITPAQAAITLRKYLEEGVVDWSHVGRVRLKMLKRLELNVHLVEWPNVDDWCDDDADLPISSDGIRVCFSYPLTGEFVFSKSGPVTIRTFVDFVVETYRKIYEEEKSTATIQEARASPRLLNRNRTDGKYGIWGHDIGDLVLEGANLEEGVWQLHIGS